MDDRKISYSHRTQISLSPQMYKRLMREKGDKSLAEHLRELVRKSWEKDTGRKEKFEEFKKAFSKPMKKKAPTTKEVLKWQKEIRRDRLVVGR